MLSADIVDVFASSVENKIGKEWKHEVVVLGTSSVHVSFEIDGKEYVAVLHEITEGHNYSEYVSFHLPPIPKPD